MALIKTFTMGFFLGSVGIQEVWPSAVRLSPTSKVGGMALGSTTGGTAAPVGAADALGTASAAPENRNKLKKTVRKTRKNNRDFCEILPLKTAINEVRPDGRLMVAASPRYLGRH